MTKEKRIFQVIISLLIGVATLTAGFLLSYSSKAHAGYSTDYRIDPDTITFSTEGYPTTCLGIEDGCVYSINSYTSTPSNWSNLAEIKIIDDCYKISFYNEPDDFWTLNYDSEFSLQDINTGETQYFAMDSEFNIAVTNATFELDSSGYYTWTSPKISEHITSKDSLVIYGNLNSDGSADYNYKLGGLYLVIDSEPEYVYGSKTLGVTLNVNVLGDWANNKTNPSSRTDVLDDLKQAENFNEADYPKLEADNSLEVIQIAESANDELFIYIYHPGGVEKTAAKNINISRNADDTISVEVYELQLLSQTETLAKYYVNNLKVLDESTRYYNITSVSRAWIDEDGDGGNALKSYKVGKKYIVTGEGENISYSVSSTEVVVIENLVSGFIRYSEGNTYLVGTATFESCDSWYVAFSTDIKIDKLKAAKVYYVSKTCEETSMTFAGTSYKYGEETSDYVYLRSDETGGTTPNGDYKDKKYSWSRIQSVDSFIAENKSELSTELKNKLSGKEWILRYLETDYSSNHYSTADTYTTVKKYTTVSKVTVIELEFEVNGEVYNLGTICDTSVPTTEPDEVIKTDPNDEVDDFFAGIREWFESLGKGIQTFFTIVFWILVGIAALFVLKLLFGLISKIVDIFKRK